MYNSCKKLESEIKYDIISELKCEEYCNNNSTNLYYYKYTYKYNDNEYITYYNNSNTDNSSNTECSYVDVYKKERKAI